MRRLPRVLLVIAGLALLTGSAVSGCSSAPGLSRAAAARAAVRATPTATARAQKVGAPAADLMVSGDPTGVKATEGELVDGVTGQVLWGRNMNTERPMASITKVMTAYLVISAGDLSRKITIPKGVLNYVAEYGASSADLEPGEVLTAGQLLYGLLLQSGADAAYTLATVYGPGMNAFIAKMNATAKKLGMLHTHFASPDGLPYPTETATYSTPADLVTLGETAMQSAAFRSIVDQRDYVLSKGDGHDAHWWGNDNGLIGAYPGALGIKTGFTDVAMHCLLFAAVRDGRYLIGVVMGSPLTGAAAGAQDAARVLDWGFSLKKTPVVSPPNP